MTKEERFEELERLFALRQGVLRLLSENGDDRNERNRIHRELAVMDRNIMALL